MEELPVPREVIARRLKRVAGQVRGCARMVEQAKECPDILTQMAAARAALSATAALVLTNYAHLCLERERHTGEAAHSLLARALSLWVTGTAESVPPRAGAGVLSGRTRANPPPQAANRVPTKNGR